MSQELDLTPLTGKGMGTDTLNLPKLDLSAMPRREAPKGALQAGVDKALASQSRAASQLVGGLGFEEAANNLSDYSEKKYAEWRKFNPQVGSYKDIKNFGTLMDYVGENLATTAPEIGAMLLGRLGLVANAVSYFGDTVNEQIEKGEGVDVNRALVTSGAESLLNLPLTKGMVGMLSKLDTTTLTAEAKKNMTADLVKNFAVDGGTNGAQHIIRQYGVQGVFDATDIDEAIVGGMLTTSPIRLAENVVSRARQQDLAVSASEHAATTGDIQGAHGFIQSALDFTVGTALRPVKRFMEGTEAGKDLTRRIDEMRTSQEVMSADLTTRIHDIFKSVKDPESLRYDYAKGKRDTPELKKLADIMDDVHARANFKGGANLDTGYIANYLPTLFDKETFNWSDMATKYRLWYEAQTDKGHTGADGVRRELPTPEAAAETIQGFAKGLQKDTQETQRLPKVKMDSDGNLVTPNLVDSTSPLKNGNLERSRDLWFIPQHILNEQAIGRNFKEQLLNYAQSAAHRITYAEQLGKNNEMLNTRVAEMNAEAKATASQGMTNKELNTFYDAMDAYQGTYGQFQTETGKKFASVARSIANVAALPLTALSSLTEPFNVAIKVGNVAAGKAFIKSLGSISRDLISTFTGGIVEKSTTNRQLLLAGRSFKNATTALNNRINGEHLTPAMQNFNNAFFHATGQTAINYLVNTMAVHAMEGQVNTDIQRVNAGNINNRGRVEALHRLNELGISEALAKEIHRNPNTLDAMKPQMVAKFNRDVALNPEALDKPIWHSTGWGAMFTQLRGYPTMFANTVLPNLYQVVDPRGKSASELAVDTARFATTTGAILFIGFLQESLKNELRGNNLDDEEIFMKAYRNTLAPIHHGYVYDAATGNLSRLVVPVSFSIYDQQIKNLAGAVNGDFDLDKLPVLSSFRGL